MRNIAGTADSVIVVAGAIFTEAADQIGPGGVAVPPEMYKVQDGRAWLTVAILPNEESRSSLDSLAVTVAEVEGRTGLKFFRLLGTSH